MSNTNTKKRLLPDDIQDDSWAQRIHRIRCELGDGEQPLPLTALAERFGIRFATVQGWETGQYQPKGAYVRLVNNYVSSIGKGHLIFNP